MGSLIIVQWGGATVGGAVWSGKKRADRLRGMQGVRRVVRQAQRGYAFGPFTYPQKKNVELDAPMVIGFPRDSRGRHAARQIRQKGHVPVVLQGRGEKEVLLTVEANRLMHLRKKGMLEKETTLQLDYLGEVIPVIAKQLPLDPISGRPTSLVVARAKVTVEELKEQQAQHVQYPDPLYPLGWHHK